MASFSVSGIGTHALSAGVGALHVHVDTLPVGTAVGTANPANYYHVGMLRFGDGIGWWVPIPIEGIDTWIPVPRGSTLLGYSVRGAGAITVTEVLGPNPFEGPAGPAGPAGSSGAGAVTLLDSTLGAPAANFDLSGIAATYKRLEILGLVRGTSAALTVGVWLRINGDSGAHYYYAQLTRSSISGGGNTNAATQFGLGTAPGANDTTTDDFAIVQVQLPFYASSRRKLMTFTHLTPKDALAGQIQYDSGSGEWDSSAVIAQLTLLPNGGNWDVGSRCIVLAT